MEQLNNKTINKLIILTAPSGAGKTTIAHELLRRMPELTFSVSVTTRPPRAGEIDGKDYYFVSVDEFKQKIAEGAFLEYEMVYEGKYYGTLYSELERIWQQHKYPLRVVDVVGAMDLKKLFDCNALSIFIKPPSHEILEKRLLLRNTDNAFALAERLKRAEVEMQYEKDFEHLVINNDLETAVEEVVELISKFIYPV